MLWGRVFSGRSVRCGGGVKFVTVRGRCSFSIGRCGVVSRGASVGCAGRVVVVGVGSVRCDCPRAGRVVRDLPRGL